MMIKKMSTIIKGLPHIGRSHRSQCAICNRKTITIALSRGEEIHRCLGCGCNLRYKLLAQCLRQHLKNGDTVVDFDHKSPMRSICREKDAAYMSTIFDPQKTPGDTSSNGHRYEDLTSLTFGDCSVDLMISSDVLEHVPDLAAAFTETARVLTPGGCHLFTVPTRPATKARARIVDGMIVHDQPPEYHMDPLNSKGILAYWDIGLDLAEYIAVPGLEITPMTQPIGLDRRFVWRAMKLSKFEGS